MIGRFSRPCLLAILCAMECGLIRGQDEPSAPMPMASETAATPSISPSTNPPGLAPTPSEPTLSTPSAARANDFLPDASNGTKFYTFTASLREEYDDNIFTTRNNKVASPVTEFSPSLLLNFPESNSDLSMRFTFGLDYFENGRSGDPNDYTGEFLLHYTHQFSNRFSLDVAEQGGYFTEPDLLNQVGTPFRNGGYFQNTATAEFDAQWTPLFGTITSYSNVAIQYEDSEVGKFQDEDENTLSNDFRFAIYPKYNLTAGFIVDDLDYFQVDRGYINTTIDAGVDWQALPSLSVSLRGGGSLTEDNGTTSDSVSPYGSLSLNWILGKRSNLTLDYSHSVQPTDVITAVGEEADRFSVRFAYDVTARTNVFLSGTYTRADYTTELLRSGSAFTEDDIGLNLGASYRINGNFSVETGYFLSDISSQEDFRDYTRNQVYLGIRGTY